MSTRTEQSSPVFPLIHYNGNSRQSLLDGYINARRDLQKAIDSFYAIDFHRRNYYPLRDGSWEIASTERNQIREGLHKAQQYLELHIEHLNNTTGGI